MTLCFECSNEIVGYLPHICGKCQWSFCSSCFIAEFCSDCTEEEYRGRLRFYMRMNGLRQYYRNAIKWALHTYSLYELYYDITVANIVDEWVGIFKTDSKPEQEGTVGKVVWVTH